MGFEPLEGYIDPLASLDGKFPDFSRYIMLPMAKIVTELIDNCHFSQINFF